VAEVPLEDKLISKRRLRANSLFLPRGEPLASHDLGSVMVPKSINCPHEGVFFSEGCASLPRRGDAGDDGRPALAQPRDPGGRGGE
jgi:hypothetical protein